MYYNTWSHQSRLISKKFTSIISVQEDQIGAMVDRDRWRNRVKGIHAIRMTWWWWWWNYNTSSLENTDSHGIFQWTPSSSDGNKLWADHLIVEKKQITNTQDSRCLFLFWLFFKREFERCLEKWNLIHLRYKAVVYVWVFVIFSVFWSFL